MTLTRVKSRIKLPAPERDWSFVDKLQRRRSSTGGEHWYYPYNLDSVRGFFIEMDTAANTFRVVNFSTQEASPWREMPRVNEELTELPTSPLQVDADGWTAYHYQRCREIGRELEEVLRQLERARDDQNQTTS